MLVIKIKDVIKNLININTNTKEELQEIHPKQWLYKPLPIPIWKIKYSYTTVRGNDKEYCKYIIANETDWDCVEWEFNNWLEEFNNDNPERQLSNVQILDTEFLGEFLLELE